MRMIPILRMDVIESGGQCVNREDLLETVAFFRNLSVCYFDLLRGIVGHVCLELSREVIFNYTQDL